MQSIFSAGVDSLGNICIIVALPPLISSLPEANLSRAVETRVARIFVLALLQGRSRLGSQRPEIDGRCGRKAEADSVMRCFPENMNP